MGRLMAEYNQTPWQLGFCDKPDISLLYRARNAASLARLAEQVARDASQVSLEDMLQFYLPYQKAIDEVLRRPH